MADYMTSIRWDLRMVLLYKSSPPFTQAELSKSDLSVRQHMVWLNHTFKIYTTATSKRTLLGKADLRLKLKHLLSQPAVNQPSIQDAVLHLVHYFTACHPGSILTTKIYESRGSSKIRHSLQLHDLMRIDHISL